MRPIFSFFLRLFFAFLAARFLARFLGLEGLGSLLGLTFLLLGNIYLFDYLDYRSRTSWRRRAARPPAAAPEMLIPSPEPPPPPPEQTLET